MTLRHLAGDSPEPFIIPRDLISSPCAMDDNMIHNMRWIRGVVALTLFFCSPFGAWRAIGLNQTRRRHILEEPW